MSNVTLHPVAPLNFFRNRIEQHIDEERQRWAQRGYDFQERTAANHTIGDFIGVVLAIEDAGDAALFYDGYLEWSRERKDRVDSPHTPESIAKANIGWCFGEGMQPDLIKMWTDVCGASHPVFDQQMPSLQEVFDRGVQDGRAMNQKDT